MRRTKTTYWGLLCLLGFIVYLRLTRRRRRKRIAYLETVLGFRGAQAKLEKQMPTVAAYLYELQGAVREVFPTPVKSSTFDEIDRAVISSILYKPVYVGRGGPISDEEFEREFERPKRKADSLPEYGGAT